MATRKHDNEEYRVATEMPRGPSKRGVLKTPKPFDGVKEVALAEFDIAKRAADALGQAAISWTEPGSLPQTVTVHTASEELAKTLMHATARQIGAKYRKVKAWDAPFHRVNVLFHLTAGKVAE